jgi:hypothetical protein
MNSWWCFRDFLAEKVSRSINFTSSVCSSAIIGLKLVVEVWFSTLEKDNIKRVWNWGILSSFLLRLECMASHNHQGKFPFVRSLKSIMLFEYKRILL